VDGLGVDDLRLGTSLGLDGAGLVLVLSDLSTFLVGVLDLGLPITLVVVCFRRTLRFSYVFSFLSLIGGFVSFDF